MLSWWLECSVCGFQGRTRPKLEQTKQQEARVERPARSFPLFVSCNRGSDDENSCHKFVRRVAIESRHGSPRHLSPRFNGVVAKGGEPADPHFIGRSSVEPPDQRNWQILESSSSSSAPPLAPPRTTQPPPSREREAARSPTTDHRHHCQEKERGEGTALLACLLVLWALLWQLSGTTLVLWSLARRRPKLLVRRLHLPALVEGAR